MERWEYKWIFVDADKGPNINLSSDEGIAKFKGLLAELGDAGWELVAVVPYENTQYVGGGGGGTVQTQWVFKRQK